MSKGAQSSSQNRLLEQSSFLRHYLWKYRRLVGLGLLSLVIVDLLEVFPPILLKQAVDIVVERRPLYLFAYWALVYLALSLIQALGRYGWRMYLIRSSMLAGRDLRLKFTDHLLGLSATFFDRTKIGDLMSLAINDIDAVRMALGAGILTLADALFYLLTVPVAMFLLSPKLALLAFIPLPLVPWLVIRKEKEIHQRFQKVQESFGNLAAMASENLNGIRVIKGFAREDAQIEQFRKAGEAHMQLGLDLAKIQSAFGPTLDFVMSLGLILLLYVGGNHVLEGAITLGTFVAFQRYIQKMIWPMTAVAMGMTYYQRALASSDRLKEVLTEKSNVPESPTPKFPQQKTRGQIEFRNLSFAYPQSDQIILSNIQLSIQPGERVAFVGMIGAGKSALLSLLPRLYPVGRGMLFLDGVDINDWPLQELRNQVGYVGQEVFLFSESVIENVAYGIYNWSVGKGSVEPVEQATQLASVHEDILNLTDGYRTRLGERGMNLSGGQKQRLTIARALAKQPAVLILDDALSAVDVQTEERILRGLRSRPGRNTEIIAAHRISTIKDADRIVVLQNGSLIQEGPHHVLLKQRQGAYWKFYEQQRLKDDFEEYVDRIEQTL